MVEPILTVTKMLYNVSMADLGSSLICLKTSGFVAGVSLLLLMMLLCCLLTVCTFTRFKRRPVKDDTYQEEDC